MERGDLPNYFGPELTREELLRNYQDKGDRFVKEEIRTLEDERRCLYRDTIYKDRLKMEQSWARKVSMTMSSADVLNSHLKPLCSRDNHVMRYESRGFRSNAGHQASYHCGFEGCSVRYDATDGYYMLIGMPNHANPVDEPWRKHR